MFESVHIVAQDLNDAYFTLLWKLWEKGRKNPVHNGSFAGSNRLEFDFVSGIIHFPHTRPLAPIMPRGIAPVTTDEKIGQYFANYIMNPALSKNEHYKYAEWINGTINYHEYGLIGHTEDSAYWNKETPIEWVIRHFKTAGYGNNHCYINIGNVDSGFAYDMPYKNEAERKTSPCFRGIQFMIKDGKLLTFVVFRSWDLYGGFPENMGGFTLLNEYVAEQLGDVEPGPLCFTSMGLHCYDHQIKPMLSILNKDEELITWQ
jgi:thymidylate synthase